jgi:hypothetical protein
MEGQDVQAQPAKQMITNDVAELDSQDSANRSDDWSVSSSGSQSKKVG